MVRLKQPKLGICLSCCLLLSIVSTSARSEPGPEAMLQEVTDDVLAEIRRDPAQLQDVARVRALVERFILPHVDFQTAARWVLGKYWRTATPGQRVRFVDEFRQLLLNTYLRSISNYRENRIRILPARSGQTPGRAEVDVEIDRPGGPPVRVSFRLHRPGTDWLIYDISVEGVSLVATHRSSFSKEIHDNGLDSLIDRLARLNAGKAGAGGEASVAPGS